MTTKQILRAMAWERAKGELRACLATFDPDNERAFSPIVTHFESFMKKVEDEGWME